MIHDLLWFKELNIDLFVLEFLDRYGTKPNLGGIELMNEPTVNLDALKKYYQEAYAAVRKYNPSAYVIMSKPMNADSDWILSFCRGFRQSSH